MKDKKYPNLFTYNEIKDLLPSKPFIMELVDFKMEEEPSKESDWFDEKSLKNPNFYFKIVIPEDSFNWNDYYYFDYIKSNKSCKIVKKTLFNKMVKKHNKIFESHFMLPGLL